MTGVALLMTWTVIKTQRYFIYSFTVTSCSVITCRNNSLFFSQSFFLQSAEHLLAAEAGALCHCVYTLVMSMHFPSGGS